MKKPSKKKTRNAFAISAKKRKAGTINPKSEKRQNGKNKRAEFLKEIEN